MGYQPCDSGAVVAAKGLAVRPVVRVGHETIPHIGRGSGSTDKDSCQKQHEFNADPKRLHLWLDNLESIAIHMAACTL
jgi:hypothetical protein